MNERYLGSFGRRLLSWRLVQDHRELAFFDAWMARTSWPRRKFVHNARATLLGEEAVGVFEPNGRFALVALSDGHLIADLKLQWEPSLAEITLLSIDDQYFMLADSSARSSLIGPIGGLSRKIIHSGRLYAFDRQGTLQWESPAKIKGQCLLTHQPAYLPVLAFAATGYRPKRAKPKM